MSFPTSPTDGQTSTVNNIVYTYSSANNTWTRQSGAFVNLGASGNISAVGNIYGNYIVGNVSGSVTTAQTVTTNAQPNITSVGTLTSVTSSGLISTTGNVSGNYILGNGSQLTGLPASYGNANLANIGSNAILTTGNVTANYFIGNGSQLTNVVANTINTAFSGSANTFYIDFVAADGASNQTVWNSPFLTYVPTSGILGASSISANGNVTGNYILGNGALLTGVSTTSSNINSGTSNVTVVSSGGNITVGVGGTANVAVFATSGEYVTGVVSATSNITGGNVLTAGIMSSTGNATHGNILTAGLVSATGNITTANTITGVGNATTGVTAGIFGVPNVALHAYSVITSAGNANQSSQFAFQNFSTGSNASADLAIYNNLGTDSQYFIDMGIVSSGYNGTAAGANLFNPNDGYVYVAGNSITGPVGTGANIGNLILGTTTGQVITWVGNTSTSNIVTVTSNTGVAVTGVLSASGNITGGNILTAGIMSSTGNATHGNLSVATGTVTVGNVVNANGNGVGNIGSSSLYFNTVFAKATSAQYADLAEMYCADESYAPGTVVVFGGEFEVTVSTLSHNPATAGIVSTNPSYLMNASMECDTALEIALIGRVPCSVVGAIDKGDRLVTSNIPGVATKLDPEQYQPGCIVGKALEAYDSTNVGVIEVAVGRT